MASLCLLVNLLLVPTQWFSNALRHNNETELKDWPPLAVFLFVVSLFLTLLFNLKNPRRKFLKDHPVLLCMATEPF